MISGFVNPEGDIFIVNGIRSIAATPEEKETV
jgi:hypothetical protein